MMSDSVGSFDYNTPIEETVSPIRDLTMRAEGARMTDASPA